MFKNIFIFLFFVASLIAANVDAEVIKNIDFLINFELVEDDFVDYADEIKNEDLEIEQQEVEQ